MIKFENKSCEYGRTMIGYHICDVIVLKQLHNSAVFTAIIILCRGRPLII